MFTRLSPNFKGILLALIGFSAFSTADSTSKYLGQYYNFAQIIGGYAFFALLCLALLTPILGGFRQSFTSSGLKFHIGRMLCNICISPLIVLSFIKLPMATAYTFIFISPFVTPLLAILIFRERVQIHSWIAIILGFAGVLVALRPGADIINPWIALPLISTVFISGLFLFARPLGKEETLLSLALFPMLGNFLTTGIAGFILTGLPDPAHVPWFVLEGIVTAIGLIATGLAFRIGDSAVISPVQYVQMLWGVGVGYFIFRDMPDLWTMLGAAIIIASGIYLIETQRRGAKIPVIPRS